MKNKTKQMRFHDLPQLGDSLDGGVFSGITTDKGGQHYAIVLLNEMPEKFFMNWHDAMNWAEIVGGELPSRAESALLFCLMKFGLFLDGYHWTRDEDSRLYAWNHNFTSGGQYCDQKHHELCARAIQRIHITS